MSACTECDHDPRDFDERDSRTTLATLDALWDGLLRGLDSTSSSFPHELTESLRRDGDDVLLSLTAAPDTASARAAAVELRPEDLGEALHAAMHAYRLAGRALADAGVLGAGGTGRVVQVSANDGGVPKAALPSVTVDRHGVVGDQQRNRLHHGRPFQALSLWSAEVIDALCAEGHTPTPGACGENVTVTGLDWSAVRPGQRVTLGEVTAEVSSWAVPCRNLTPWFRDGDFRRILAELHPGWSRAYAWVVTPGRIAPGDTVTVLP